MPAAIEFGGRIEALQGDIVFVNGEGFLVSDATFFTSEDGSPFGLTDLAIGLKVRITGERDDTGALIATMIFCQRPENLGLDEWRGYRCRRHDARYAGTHDL